MFEADAVYANWRCVTGESGLHLAVVNNDMDMVRMLVTRGANVNQRASGRFFLPEDQTELQSENVWQIFLTRRSQPALDRGLEAGSSCQKIRHSFSQRA